MTVTEDWTVLEGTDTDAFNRPIALPETMEMETVEPNASFAAVAATAAALPKPKPNSRKNAAVRFPCMEQPPRYALRSFEKGLYLGGTKKGKLVGRSKRSEHDEWTIALVGNNNNNNNNSNCSEQQNYSSSYRGTNSSIVTIHNHKFGNILSMVLTDRSDLGRTAACVAPLREQQKDASNNNTNNNNNNNNNNNTTEHDLSFEDDDDDDEQVPKEQLPDDEDEDEDNTNNTNNDIENDATIADREDRMQWCVIRCSDEINEPEGGVMIVSTKTGDCLSVSEQGRIVLSPSEPFHVWELECVTGELCFLSNPTVDIRVRCDMAGILSLSPNWKGWEVVRITEASASHSHSSSNRRNCNNDDGYVRISSWMHSQWVLCSDAAGTVSTCSVSESLLMAPIEGTIENNNNNNNTNKTNNDYRCSKWAIEKYPADENSNHEGLIIRSVTHGRLLSIKDGSLRTYASNLDEMQFVNNGEPTNGSSIANASSTTTTTTAITTRTTTQGDAIGEIKRHTEEIKRRSSNWWKQSLTNVQKSLSESAIQRRNSKLVAAGLETPIASNVGAIPEEETIVWQLEAAHLQTYYFLTSETASTTTTTSTADDDSENNSIRGEEKSRAATNTNQPPRSIGVFPSVTGNLRKSDKIQLVRNDDSPDTLKLFLPDEQFYITCSSKGSILATKQEGDEGTEWIIEESENENNETGSVFRSKAHGLYLSLRNEELSKSKSPPLSAFEATANPEGDTADATHSNNNNSNNSNDKRKKKTNPFENLKLLPHQKAKPLVAELCATETPTTWNLEPCTPRAISSKRLKTFAIGTSIAVGTTIAMPFAIAGVAAAMGALGAEAGIGFGIVAAAATGAEALASVGAIGATAYFCFRPEQNSLGDDLDDEDKNSNTAKPWSKRPFGNWRNW